MNKLVQKGMEGTNLSSTSKGRDLSDTAVSAHGIFEPFEPGLVSILTPAYNCGTLIQRLLDSILGQTYPGIEMIAVNDGSTDKTEEVLKSYISRFKDKGYTLTVLTQKNQGQTVAIDRGLKLLKGEYLVWPDSDDWYSTPESIEKLVNALKAYGDDVAISRCAYNNVREKDLKLMYIHYPDIGDEPVNIFENAMTGKGKGNFSFCPGGWMVKTKFMDELIPGRNIFTHPMAGQNAQIMWPYMFYKKCVSVEEPLFTYLHRADSHSHTMTVSLDRKLATQDVYLMTFKAVLRGIKDLNREKREQYIERYANECLRNKINLCASYGDYKRYRSCFNELKGNGKLNLLSCRTKVSYYLSYSPIILKFVKKLHRIAERLHHGRDYFFQ